MAYNAIFEQIFLMLYNDPNLVPGILGTRTATNLRIYRAFVQMQSMLSSYEPSPPEGWIVIEEAMPVMRLGAQQWSSNHEYCAVAFQVFATQYSLTHDALDLLDTYFHFEIEQQRDLVFGERIVLFTRRTSQQDKYAQDVKLFQKTITYDLEMVRATALTP